MRAIAFALDVAQMLDAAVVDQGIDQRAVGVIDRGMAHKPRLLGDDEHVVVLVADIERDGLALHRACSGASGTSYTTVSPRTAYAFSPRWSR